MRRIPFVVLLALATPCLPLAAQDAPASKQPFSAERSWELQRIAAPALSPDGRWAVASIARPDVKENKQIADLWIWATDGSIERRLTAGATNESSPVFSPDGKRLAFVAQRDSDTAPQIYVIALDGGEAVRVTNFPTGVAQIDWAPDGSRLFFLSRIWADLGGGEEQGKRLTEREASKVKAQIWDTAPVTHWDQFVDDRQIHLFSVAIDGGEPLAITRGTGLELDRSGVQFDSVLYDVSPDGKEVAFVADSDPRANETNLDVYLLAIGETQARNVTSDNPADDGAPAYSPDGRWLAFNRQKIRGFYADMQRLMLRDRASGQTKELHASWDRSKGGLLWSPDGKQLFGAIDDAGTSRIYEVPLEGKPRAITTDPSFGSFALAQQVSSPGTAPVAVALRQSFIEPPTLVRIELATGRSTKLSTANDALLASTDFGSYESVTYTGARGDKIQMWVNYPPGFDRTKQYPLFLLIHGGPHNGQTNGTQWRWNAQVFGSWGYVTGWPNFHGSSGFGQAFTDSINPQQDALPYEDVIKAAEWFKAQPWIDGNRMVAGGGSYGGYLTSILLGRPHPFNALLAHAAVYNWYTQYASDYMTELPRFGGFWEASQQEVFRRGSPHLGAGNFKTPTLVVHGQKDQRVPVNHGFELYQTLLMRGVPTRMLYFPDENHWVLKPQNSLLWYSEVRKWFEQWNKPR